MSAVVNVRNLSVQLQSNKERLVNEVSFEVQRGEIFALVGESGSGKSLTAMSLMRLLPDALAINGGEVILGDQKIFRVAELDMNRIRGSVISMIFQEPQTSLNPVQTIGKQLAEVLAIHKKFSYEQSLPVIVELLKEVGIHEPEKRVQWYPHQLSGGQKQRVMIAMALACEPDVLVADEPTTALDVTIQKQVLQLLQELCKKRQLAVLLITHDMGVVAEVADRVAVMRRGKIIEQQISDQFFKQPKTDYSRLLIDSLPDRKHFLPAESGSTLMSVDNLKVWFPIRKGVFQRTVDHTRAVDGISFSIKQGETLALVGESGCGKTTTGKALLKLESFEADSVQFDGKEIKDISSKDFNILRREIQIIFQDPFSSMNPRFTVKNIIEEGMVSLGVESDPVARERKIVELLQKVGLEQEHLHRYPHEFSGGQRQRIAIARALSVKPRLIICDEPTSALDVSIRGQVLELLRQLQTEEGISFIFITHDLSLIPHLAHRVAVMKEGKIIEQGDTEQVMTNPQQEYTRLLLDSAPKYDF